MRRLAWLVVGAGFGFGLSFWATRLLRRAAARYSPEQVASDLGRALRSAGSELREALAEGRRAAVEREAELRETLGR